jgi:hypothetical protein
MLVTDSAGRRLADQEAVDPKSGGQRFSDHGSYSRPLLALVLARDPTRAPRRALARGRSSPGTLQTTHD